MNNAMEQIQQQFETKKMMEKRENRFLNAIVHLEGRLTQAERAHFYLKKGEFGHYFQLNDDASLNIIVDPSSGDLRLENPIMYTQDHVPINLQFGVNDSLLYVYVSDEEEDILLFEYHSSSGYKATKAFIHLLCG